MATLEVTGNGFSRDWKVGLACGVTDGCPWVDVWQVKRIIGGFLYSEWDFFETQYYGGNITEGCMRSAGTLFGAYNAVTGYFQNIRSYNTNGNVDLSKKIENNLFGSGMRTSESAFKMANGIYTNNTVSQLN